MLSLLPLSSHTCRSQKLPGSTETQTSPLPECLLTASPTCQELFGFCFFGFFFLQIPIKRATGWAASRWSWQGCRGWSWLSGQIFSASVCCCWWGAPGAPFGHWLLEEKWDAKGRGGRRRDWSGARSVGGTWHPHSRSPMARHGDSLAGRMDGAGIRRLCQEMGLVGTAVNSSVRGKL